MAASPSDQMVAPASCQCASPAPACDNGCDGSTCDGLGGGLMGRRFGSGCSCGGGLLGGSLLGGGDCCLGEAWTLFPNDNCYGIKIAGWSNVGYHTANTNFNFNNYDGRTQLQQQWFYAERVANGANGLDWGARIDYLYGTDGPDTQAFGVLNDHWDNGWDNGGAYGHSIPQLYGELAYDKLSVKVGHFFTIIGQEVVAATGNFFYSRQFTFYNAEPFTHTGALTTYALDDDTTLWNGYVMGWDSGFEDNGDAYIGGFKRALSDTSSFIYTNALGRFNEQVTQGGNAERGTIHSVILTEALTDKLTFISQADWLHTNYNTGIGARNTFGLINYLIYKVNDRVSLGSRSEWFNYSSEALGLRNLDIYNQTYGINYRVSSNLLIRPEVRTVWDRDATPFGINEQGRTSQTVFGSDLILTF
jgi:hypothetical protein